MTTRLAAFLAALLFSCAALAADKPLTATYSILKNGQHVGDMTETFSRTGTTYRIESETKAVGIYALFSKGNIKMVSQGEITKDGLKPLHFEHHRGSDPGRLIVADFDWAAGKLHVKYDGKSESLPLPPGTQDRLSQMYQFMFLNHPALELNFSMTNGRGVESYRYKLLGEEQLPTPLGGMKTLRYSRVDTSGPNGVDIWLALPHGFLPARMNLQEKDGKLEQILNKVSAP